MNLLHDHPKIQCGAFQSKLLNMLISMIINVLSFLFSLAFEYLPALFFFYYVGILAMWIEDDINYNNLGFLT